MKTGIYYCKKHYSDKVKKGFYYRIKKSNSTIKTFAFIELLEPYDVIYISEYTLNNHFTFDKTIDFKAV